RLPNSGCLLLTISAATSAAAFDACPAAAALPVSGHRMPILTVPAACAGGIEIRAAAAASAAALIPDDFATLAPRAPELSQRRCRGRHGGPGCCALAF